MYDTSSASVYEWAKFLNYQTAKWDVNKAYAEFKANANLTTGGVLYTSGVLGGWVAYVQYPRTYDECLETARCFMEFYMRYGIADALVSAKTMADWAVAHCWNGTIIGYTSLGGIEVASLESGSTLRS